MGDKATISFALVHSGCKQNTGDMESSVSKRQPDLIAGLGSTGNGVSYFPFLSVYAASFQQQLLACCRLNTLLLYLLCSFLTLCFLPCYNNAFPP